MAVLPTGIGPVTGYNVERSLRFNSADTAYLNRTPAGAGNLQTWTWSGWVKRSALGSSQTIFALFDYLASPLTNKQHGLRFLSGDTIEYWCYQDPSYNGQKITTQVFRDVSAWYHIVAVWDTPNATAANRMRLYVNGSEVTTFGTNTNPTQNSNGEINRAFLHTIGTFYDPDFGSPTNSLNGYLTEVNFIGGQALTPSSFGETDTNTGVWKPKAFSGTYGTNGFYLKFADNSGTTSTTLGKDSSGNGNNWTPNGFVVSPATSANNDSLVDSPTSYGGDTGAGGEVRGNYCTLNPLDKGTNATLANGNLFGSTSTTAWAMIRSTFAISSGKWYWEFTVATTQIIIGLAKSNAALANYVGADANGWGWYGATGNKVTGGTQATYVGVWAANDVIGVSFDADVGTLVFYKNGTSQGTAYTGLTSGPYFPAISFSSASDSANANFGQRPFAYTAPSGFKALCTQNLPTPTIGATSTTQANDYFNVLTYTGNGTDGRTVTGVGFNPDLVWVKGRSNTGANVLADSVRGSDKNLYSNLTDAETNPITGASGGGVGTVTTDGFVLEQGTVNMDLVNTNARTYVAWNWNAGGSNQTISVGQYATSPANVPSIASTVRANTTSKFSIVTYTGNGTNGATVGHGLGTTPAMVIIKSRSLTGSTPSASWIVWHRSISQAIQTGTTIALTGFTGATVLNSTAPSTTYGFDAQVNGSTQTYVAYCFADVAGYSAFGSYTGNGTGTGDGPFVYTGFRPRYVLIKKTATGAGNAEWYVHDTARDDYNQARFKLYPSSTVAENGVAGETTTTNAIDILSNGFKLRTGNGATNESAIVYIYAAFAEHPFKYSLAR